MISGESEIRNIISRYHGSFSTKVYSPENDDHDVLMDVFGITPELKRQNRQYWGRELGMCWQLLVTELFRTNASDFGPPYREGNDELSDLMAGDNAIDTKYRVGSGDSGTLKKFKQYGNQLRDRGFTPILLILREDNLAAAITACRAGTWEVYTGQTTFDYIKDKTNVNLEQWLTSLDTAFQVNR